MDFETYVISGIKYHISEAGGGGGEDSATGLEKTKAFATHVTCHVHLILKIYQTTREFFYESELKRLKLSPMKDCE